MPACRAKASSTAFTAPPLPKIAAAKDLGIRVEDFPVQTGFRKADAIFEMGLRRKIAHEHKIVFRTFGAPDEDHDRVVGVVKIDPLEALVLEIDFIHARVHCGRAGSAPHRRS